MAGVLKKLGGFLFPPAGVEPESVQRLDGNSCDPFFGRMQDYTAAGYVKGPCGDSMEFYLVIKNEQIEKISYYTDGCDDTRLAGQAVARRAAGRIVMDALSISPGEIIRAESAISAEGRHCVVLAVSTLYQAIVDYLLHSSA